MAIEEFTGPPQVGEGVGQVQAHVPQPDPGIEMPQHLTDAHLSDGEGAHLLLEPDQPTCEFLHGFGAEALVATLGLSAGDEVDDAGEEGASSHRRVDVDTPGSAKPSGQSNVLARSSSTSRIISVTSGAGV
ncbi:hypothetical protein [Streptomyces sp. NPDC048361]|uniref:hypothetical protein n=1 Tax=Streptomyces sp. NPDC048361 TaxID=3154720 RepID=UPI00342E9269